MNNGETILGHLRRIRPESGTLWEIKKLIEHVEKYGCENKAQPYRLLEEIIRLLTECSSTNPDEENTSVVVVSWMTRLQEQNKLPCMNEFQFDQVVQWLKKKLLNTSSNIDLISRCCIAFCGLFASHPMNAGKYFIDTCNPNTGDLLKYVCWSYHIDIVVNVIRCLDILVGILISSQLTKEQIDICTDVGSKILKLFYGDWDTKPMLNTDILPGYLFHSLQLSHRIATISPEFAKQNVSELLGLSRAYIHFGIEHFSTTALTPQKVYMSQQALYDSAEDFEGNINSERTRNCGGKTPKTRKPRLRSNASERNMGNASPERNVALLSMDMRTSDSDASEQENTGNRVLFERNRMAKIRLASIYLIGAVVKAMERSLMYGYWHALFPCGTGNY